MGYGACPGEGDWWRHTLPSLDVGAGGGSGGSTQMVAPLLYRSVL